MMCRHGDVEDDIKMKRRLYSLFLAAVLLAAITGCIPLRRPERARVPEAYHNGYLGLTVTVPENWTVEHRNTANMTDEAVESSRWDSLEREDYGDGAAYIDLIELNNEAAAKDRNQIRMHLFAEDYLQWYDTVDEYVDASIEAYTGPIDSDFESVFRERDQRRINGKVFDRLLYEAVQTDGPSYYMEYNICHVGDLYLTVYADYWENLDGGQQQAASYLEAAVALDASVQPEPREDGDFWSGEALGIRYNGYLGLQVQEPEGFQCTYFEPMNLTLVPDDSRYLQQMLYEDYEDGGGYYDLAYFEGLDEESDDSCVSIELYAEQYAAYPEMEEYLAYFIQSYRDAWASQELAAVCERSQVMVGDRQYERLDFSMGQESYRADYYIYQVGELYFVACLVYPPEADATREDGAELLNECAVFQLPDMVRI